MDTCTACGAALPPQSRFCGVCGTMITKEPAPDSTHVSEYIPINVSAADTIIRPNSGPSPIVAPIPAPQPGVTGSELIPPQINEAEQRQRQADMIGALPMPGTAAPPTPHMPSIHGTPQPSTIPTMHGTPSMGGTAAPPQYPPPGMNHLASGHTTQPGYIPDHTGHMLRAGHTAATKAAGGLATKWIVIVITTLVIAASGGTAVAYVLTRPQPIINVTSSYHVGGALAGSNGTTLQIQGQQFSNNSLITFLLDGNTAPGAPQVISDQHGTVHANVPITSAWQVGKHLLTARDAGNYTTKASIPIEVVAPGQAHTPGPNGAPPDDASFRMTVSAQEQLSQSTQPFSFGEALQVTGHPDPTGGSVCATTDNGQPQTHNDSFPDGTTATVTETFSCSGTYKSGKLSYSETLSSSDITGKQPDGTPFTCHLTTPGVFQQLSGSYTASGSFSGTLTTSPFPQSAFSCTASEFFSIIGGNGTWTATYTLT